MTLMIMRTMVLHRSVSLRLRCMSAAIRKSPTTRSISVFSTTMGRNVSGVSQSANTYSKNKVYKFHTKSSSDLNPISYALPQRAHSKITRTSDAISLVRSGDTIGVSGFVAQGAPESVLKDLGNRYVETGEPNNLTILFGGGPGDWEDRGLNHLAKLKGGNNENCPPMLHRAIGGHYGQVPQIASLAVSNMIEAWNLPGGSISRMIRAQATHSPGHITDIGMDTFVDPDVGNGGAINDAALKSPLHKKLVSKINISGSDQLLYRALPINVALIRATTADMNGNLSMEHESLLCDQRQIAMAAKNSGGIVIAQVKRVSETKSIPARSVVVPGSLVDCIVLVDDEDHDTLHPMSYNTRHDPVLTCEIKRPLDDIPKLDLTERKVIARRAAFALKNGNVINLGIGIPEGVASVASEEGMLDYVTVTTEAGAFGGIAASGKEFGPALNADALVEMNEMFDFYDGGGLDVCFLGAAQVSPNGDVNVSRLAKDRLTGPGGFINISQSTQHVCFMLAFTAKGLKLDIPGDGGIKIESEGQQKKFVNEIIEKTFSGNEAVRRGQKVYYVTERAVFRRSANHDVLELVEIAPGVDLQRDILDQMEFKPVISPRLKTMDPRIFMKDKMKLLQDMFGSLDERCYYDEDTHTLYIDLFGVSLATEEDVMWFSRGLDNYMTPISATKGPFHMVANYDGFNIRTGLEDLYGEEIENLTKKHYKSARRYTGSAFHRAKLGKKIHTSEWDPDELFDEFDTDKSGVLSFQQLREGVKRIFGLKLTSKDRKKFNVAAESDGVDVAITREQFAKALESFVHGSKVHD